MNKQELVSAVAEKAKLTPAQARKAVDAIFSPDPAKGLIASTLRSGGKVSIARFGTFEARQRKARTGRNPKTGEAIEIGARKHPAFHAGKTLKQKVNK
ncbi:MAG: HU family DNA-binding protein [bacterium]